MVDALILFFFMERTNESLHNPIATNRCANARVLINSVTNCCNCCGTMTILNVIIAFAGPIVIGAFVAPRRKLNNLFETEFMNIWCSSRAVARSRKFYLFKLSIINLIACSVLPYRFPLRPTAAHRTPVYFL